VGLFPKRGSLAANARVVYENVDLSPPRDDIGDGGVRRFRPRDVDLEWKSGAADGARDLIRAREIEVSHGYRSPGFGQAPRYGFPDPGGRARHDGRLPGKLESHSLFFF